MSYLNFNDNILSPVYRTIIYSTKKARPTIKNIDIWVSYFMAVKDCHNISQFAFITYSNARALGFELLQPYLEQMFITLERRMISPQAFDGFDFEEFISFFSSKIEFYKICRSSKALNFLIELFSMFVSCAGCNLSHINFKIAGVKLFKDGFLRTLERSRPTITDIFDLLFNMSDYFVKIGYLCYKTGSLVPLLYDDTSAYDMATKHSAFVSSWGAVQDGSWDVTTFNDENEYRETGVQLIEFYKDNYKILIKTNPIQANIVQRKWQEIETILIGLSRLVLCGKLRKAPFGILIQGGSSVGKSTLTTRLTTTSIIAQGGSGDIELQKVVNPKDKFFSNYLYGTEALILDDMCNVNAKFTKESPLDKIIEYINNVPSYPVMADLSSKGKIPLAPKVVTVTTNVRGLNAEIYSNEPVSILRRFNLIIDVCIKEKYAKNKGVSRENRQIDSTVIAREQVRMSNEGRTADEIDMLDIWEIKVFTVSSVDSQTIGAHADIQYIPVLNNQGGDLFTLDELLNYVYEASRVHDQLQQNVVQSTSRVPEIIRRKFAERYPELAATYVEQDFSKEESAKSEFDKATSDRTYFSFLGNFGEVFGLTEFFDIRNLSLLIPAFCFSAPVSLGATVAAYVCKVYHDKANWRRKLDSYYKWCTSDGKYIVGSSAVGCLVAAAVMRYFWQSVRDKYKPQSLLDPKTVDEMNNHSTIVQKPNYIVPKPCLIKVGAPDTMVSEELVNKVENNLVILKTQEKTTNALFICSNIFMFPHHFVKVIEARDGKLEILSHPMTLSQGGVTNHSQRFTYSTKAWVRLPDTDLCLYYMTNCKPRKLLLSHFPEEFINTNLTGKMILRSPSAILSYHTAKLYHGSTSTGLDCMIRGFKYSFDDIETYNGMCMGTWISETSPPSIVGFHLGGKTGSPFGCCGSVTRLTVENGMNVLYKKLQSAVQAGCDGFINNSFGSSFPNAKSLDFIEEIPRNSPINYMPESSLVELIGCTGETRKYYTSVQYRKMGLKFLEMHGIEVQHGPPNMNAPPKWYHFNKNLVEFCSPSVGPPLDVLEWAVIDYVTPILSKLRKFGYGEHIIVQPLTNKENINGVDGVRFLDALKMNTSAGFPLKGKTELYINNEVGNRTFISDEFWLEVGRMESEYLKGNRCYPLFVAHLKDEPVALGKDKVRVFFGNGTPFKLIVRKYWLPIVRFLSEFSTLAECAIGIDSHSLAWDEFVSWVETHGHDRCIAGDYKGYDQKEFLNVTQACYSCYIKMARVVGYSEEQIKIMSSMVADLTTFMVLYHGTVLMMPRGNASGQNLTSYVNSTANSLNSRCAYFHSCPHKNVPPFREMVSLMTYGDDDIGSVSKKCTWFNAQIKAKFLLEYGILYTPPNKEGDHVPFYDSRSVDFLKRSIVYIPEIGKHLGALNEKSILKSITCGIPTPHVTENELFGQILDGALLEYFAHGRDKYENFRQKVNEFCDKYKFSRFLATSHFDFDDRVESWRVRYQNELQTGYQSSAARQEARRLEEIEHLTFDPGLSKAENPGII
jgi:hypothetical protein